MLKKACCNIYGCVILLGMNKENDIEDREYHAKRDRMGMYIVLIVVSLLLLTWVQYEQYKIMVKSYNLEAFKVAAPANEALPNF